ncbi:MAG: hypothetical protein RPU34_12480 [Candidatus Sedimenticola sp. (ex Thyasira tokunagai)]
MTTVKADILARSPFWYYPFSDWGAPEGGPTTHQNLGSDNPVDLNCSNHNYSQAAVVVGGIRSNYGESIIEFFEGSESNGKHLDRLGSVWSTVFVTKHLETTDTKTLLYTHDMNGGNYEAHIEYKINATGGLTIWGTPLYAATLNSGSFTFDIPLSDRRLYSGLTGVALIYIYFDSDDTTGDCYVKIDVRTIDGTYTKESAGTFTGTFGHYNQGGIESPLRVMPDAYMQHWAVFQNAALPSSFLNTMYKKTIDQLFIKHCRPIHYGVPFGIRRSKDVVPNYDLLAYPAMRCNPRWKLEAHAPDTPDQDYYQFYAEIDGAVDGKSTAVMPLKSFYGYKDSAKATVFSMAAPYAQSLVDLLADRPNGKVVVKRKHVQPLMTTIDDIVACSVPYYEVSLGSSGGSLILIATVDETWDGAGSSTLSPSAMDERDDGTVYIESEWQPGVAPGDAVTADGISCAVEYVYIERSGRKSMMRIKGRLNE